jgi:predicted PurR-regulated permease PerM
MTPSESTRYAPSHRSDIVFAFAVAIGLALAYYLRDVLALLYVSALFAVVLLPVMRGFMRIRLGRWQLGRGSAVFLMVAIIAGAITIFVVFALPPVISDLRTFVLELPTRGPATVARLKRVPFASHLNLDALNARLQDWGSNFVTYIFKSFTGWANKAFKIITGIVLTIYFMLEGEGAYRWILSFFNADHRERLNIALLRAEVRMGKWLLGQGLLMLILGLLSTIVFVSLHVRYAYALGVLMGAFNLIPVVGAMISMALVIIAASMDSWGKVLGVCIFYAIYVQVENSYLTPRIMQTSVGLPGLAVIIALLLGAELEGVIGAMVSVPTAVLVAVLLEEYAVKKDAMLTPGDIHSLTV